MSNHSIEQDELMAYLDGELEARRATEAASHLTQCAECQKLAAALQEVSQMLVSWQVEEGEPELDEEVTAALKGHAPRKTRVNGHATWRSLLNPRLWPKPVWGLTTVGLIALVVLIAVVFKPSAFEPYSPRTDSVTISPATPQPTPHLPGKMPAAPRRQPNSINNGSLGTLDAKDGNAFAESSTSQRDSVGKLAELPQIKVPANETDADEQEDQETSENPPGNAPMIIRTADLGVVVKEFEKARSSVDEILRRRHGHVGELSVSNPTGAARSLTGTLRIPSNQLDAALNDLKALGRVDKESQGGEEVTQEYIDLQARLANAKHTEQRLIEIQATRTGKLSDVLAVEMQIGRVRGEIERMEAERKNMKNQVDFATLNLTVIEDYKADLKVGPPSTGTQFRNAAVDGLESVTHGIISLLLWLLSVGPTLLLWVAILFFPVRAAWRKLRPRLSPSK